MSAKSRYTHVVLQCSAYPTNNRYVLCFVVFRRLSFDFGSSFVLDYRLTLITSFEITSLEQRRLMPRLMH